MGYYAAKIGTAIGQYSISLDVDHSSGGAIQCLISMDGYAAPQAATALDAKQLDALILSLQAARRYVEQ